ncbi:NAD(+) synthase [Marinilabilia rubra]|uniref:NH(3)-dependent NAD(+) synthetase n=1 Tax=Marinilabilia rubra TaxID=2162893 RepID=A0A2U2B4Q6_9BACT|nr:NAD(+) synthase [Marinilabilia rubra]PWD98061.1 NAD(+) synthase [Marinilabilia rubra]
MANKKEFSKEILEIKNPEELLNQICEKLRADVFQRFRRRGGVVGISGGIDSSVTLAIAAKAFGHEKVLGVMLPEHDSNPDSKSLALDLAEKFGVKTVEENISHALDGFGCYQRRDEAVKRVIPEFNPETDKMKIVIPKDILEKKLPPVFYVTVIFENGEEVSKRLPPDAYLQIVAASNFKQRSRMSMLYYQAEANHFSVIGTPNKHEVKQGFFVKFGDGGADVMPIGSLYKTQVYQLAEYLGVPQEIIERTPTTDTYTAEQTQEEFFYQMPFERMDLLWFGWENGYNPAEVATVMGMKEEEVLNNFANFERKIKTTDYLRSAPLHDYDFWKP